ncbi:MAG: Exonuclease [Candidatus Parcubacteria bacterium]|jgi:DNA polymerase III epsilon subunit-like protein
MLAFPKDILVMDFEGRAEPTQAGFVLLDRATLAEKDAYVSYVYADLGGFVSPFSGISQETLKGAPTQAEVGKAVFERFGTDVLLACWVQDVDMRNFKKIMAEAGHEFSEFDYHVLDVWAAAYVHLLKGGYAGSMRSEEMFRAFGAAPRDKHDALEDARIAAHVLRAIAA